MARIGPSLIAAEGLDLLSARRAKTGRFCDAMLYVVNRKGPYIAKHNSSTEQGSLILTLHVGRVDKHGPKMTFQVQFLVAASSLNRGERSPPSEVTPGESTNEDRRSPIAIFIFLPSFS